MHSEEFEFLIVAIVMVCLVIIVVAALTYDFRIKARRMQAAAPDMAATSQLWETARRMETRIGYLETVLDTEVPGWRSRSEMR